MNGVIVDSVGRFASEPAVALLPEGDLDRDRGGYRTNQAFEGGLKEAYGVLAKKNFDKVRIFDIEQFFSKSNTFRKRVLDQFTNYRQEWRNASTYDHKLDFSDSEAFLAIVSVTAFSCLLVDEIALQLARDREEEAAKLLAQRIKNKINFAEEDLMGRVTEVLKSYFTLRSLDELESNSYPQWLGSVAGFLSVCVRRSHLAGEFVDVRRGYPWTILTLRRPA